MVLARQGIKALYKELDNLFVTMEMSGTSEGSAGC